MQVGPSQLLDLRQRDLTLIDLIAAMSKWHNEWSVALSMTTPFTQSYLNQLWGM